MENAAEKMSWMKVNKSQNAAKKRSSILVSRRKIPIRSGEEEIPLGEIIRRLKRKRPMSSDDVVYKRRKVMRPQPMVDEMNPQAEFCKNMKRIQSPKKKKSSMRTRISRKEEKKIHSSPPAVKKGFCYESSPDELSEEDSEEEKKKYLRRSPVVITDLKEYLASFRLRAFGGRALLKKYGAEEPEEPESESDEELLRECDRNEVDWGYNYVLRKRWRAITNPVTPKKIYYKSTIDPYPIEHVLHDPESPLAVLSKLALQVYNEIQGTHYEYVGLVKAYMRIMAGYHFHIRFKARLLGQDAINFQTSTHRGIVNRKTKVVPVRVQTVYPLRPC